MEETNKNAQTPESSDSSGETKEVREDQPVLEASKDARMWAMLCHLLGLFTCFVGPLIIWLIKKDEDAFVDGQGKEALNFQITVAIALTVSGLLTVVCVGIPMLMVVGVGNLVFCIVASAKSNSGKAYRYPVCIRFIK